jgi:hypothetical protein
MPLNESRSMVSLRSRPIETDERGPYVRDGLSDSMNLTARTAHVHDRAFETALADDSYNRRPAHIGAGEVVIPTFIRG